MGARVIVACGTAIATSTHVAAKIREALAQAGLSVPIVQCRITEVASLVQEHDVVVATAQLPSGLKVRCFNAVPLLTGVGAAELMERIIEAVREEASA